MSSCLFTGSHALIRLILPAEDASLRLVKLVQCDVLLLVCKSGVTHGFSGPSRLLCKIHIGVIWVRICSDRKMPGNFDRLSFSELSSRGSGSDLKQVPDR